MYPSLQWIKMAVKSVKSWWNVVSILIFVQCVTYAKQYKNDSCPVMASFSEMAKLSYLLVLYLQFYMYY